MRIRVWFKYGLRVAGALLVVTILGLSVAAAVAIRRPFPQIEGTTEVQGLKSNVDIYRDSYGVPHLYAQNRTDLFFAQGYVHAQDRFWQMENTRRVVQGRLAEVLGPIALDSDRFMRTIGLNRVTKDMLTIYERDYPHILNDLEAYSSGVNAYLAEHQNATSLNQ